MNLPFDKDQWYDDRDVCLSCHKGSDSANQPGQVVVFNGFGRPVDNTGLAQLDIDNDTSGNDFRALRIVVGAGGTIRMCEPSVNASGDPRKC